MITDIKESENEVVIKLNDKITITFYNLWIKQCNTSMLRHSDIVIISGFFFKKSNF